jgi:hypothetical protein
LDQLSREKKERNRENTLFANDLRSKHPPTNRSKIAIVESRGICRWIRPQHTVISGPCRADEQRRYCAGLNDALLSTMKNGRTLGQSAGFTQLERVIRRRFDIAAMTRLSVGPSWASLSES